MGRERGPSHGGRDTPRRQLGTDPRDADTDHDGLSDGDELDLGLDPLDGDTDSDGLDDGDELDFGTDPHAPDSDNDGLLDGAEVDLGTDPLAPDTDGDGMDDGDELDQGQDPLDASNGAGSPGGGVSTPGADPFADEDIVAGGACSQGPSTLSWMLGLPLLALARRRQSST